MPDQSKLKRVLLWVLVSGILLVALCWRFVRPKPEVAFGCPEHYINITTLDTVVTSIPLAPETTEIPEYHDCQRMQVGKTFGPLIAIWAAQDLPAFFPGLPDRTADSTVYAVAQILNLGNGPAAKSESDDYAPLSIQSGFSCVFVWRSQPPDSFSARIVHLGNKADLHRCVNTDVGDRFVLGGQPLSVRAIRDPRVAASDIPPVARWDQDPDSHDQYIGIRCGDAWCEIGPREGFTSSRPAIDMADAAGAVQAAYEADAAYAIPETRWMAMQTAKGWYDQQELDVWDANHVLVPSGVMGTIIPNPVLDVIGGSATATGPKFYHRWVPAAYIYVTGKYQGKQLQLEQGVSRLYLCKGFFGDCPGVTLTTSDADSMWSMMVGPGGDTTYHSVEYNEHGGGVIPAGAARWRWLETDGTLWTRCDDGCCTNR